MRLDLSVFLRQFPDMINFGGIIETSTLDYPGKAAMVIFFRGCPFRCIYCQNEHLLSGNDLIGEEIIEAKIRDAKIFISAVVFSGGEPFMQFDPLSKLASYAKASGLLVGIETCGYYPEKIRALGERRLIDSLFLDIKAPLDDPKRYEEITGVRNAAEVVKESLSYSCSADFNLEVRTTVFKGVIGPDEIEKIARALEGFDGTYVIQEGISAHLETFSYNEIRRMGEIAATHLNSVRIRTKEKGLETLNSGSR